MGVRISTDISAGSVEVYREVHEMMVEDGTARLAEVLVDAVNATLRSYGLPANVAVVTRSSEALYRLSKREVGN